MKYISIIAAKSAHYKKKLRFSRRKEKNMGFYEEAEARIHKELPSVKGQKEGAIKGAVKDALLNFARQEEEFAQAIVQGGSFQGCMAAVCKGISTSISDLEAYAGRLGA